MADAPTISSDPPARISQNYAALRALALDEIQRLAPKTWTDHNVHDPGITILEAFCYAITELGLRLELDIADLIESGAALAPPALPPAEAVLPCGPVTAEDLRRRLLDHYLVGEASIGKSVKDSTPLYADPGGEPPLTLSASPGAERLTPRGLFEVLLSFEDRPPEDPDLENPDLNTNIYAREVTVGTDSLSLDFALPHWDEPEAAAFRQRGLTLTAATMLIPAAPWVALDEDLAYFGRARIDFTGPDGASFAEIWVVVRITTPLSQPLTQIPPILPEAQAEVQSIATGGLIDAFRQRVAGAAAAAATVARDLTSWRNLAEAPVAVAVSRTQEIAIDARIEVARPTGLETFLAALLFDLDCRLAPPARFAGLAERRLAGAATDALFDGPLLSHGFLPPTETQPLLRGDRIFVSDILNLILTPRDTSIAMAQQQNPTGRDIVAVTELSLSNFVNNRRITGGATDCLRLVEIARHRPRLSVAKSRIVFVRDDVEIPFDSARVEALVAEHWKDKLAGSRRANLPNPLPVPTGDRLPTGAYYPFQNDLPTIYGVGPAGLPGSATRERRQAALQLRAYLLLFEQFLADTAAQLANINRLFSPAANESTTYFTHPLLELEGMERLVAAFTGDDFQSFANDPGNAYAMALGAAAEDAATAVDRRNRMLDHLLARQGENAVAWGQELHRWGERGLLRTSDTADLEKRLAERQTMVNRVLMASKAAFLADLPRLHALRLAAFADPLQWDAGLVVVSGEAGAYSWRIVRGGAPVMEGPVKMPPEVAEELGTVATAGEALTRGREALKLAGAAVLYGAQNFGGPSNRRFVLRIGRDAGDPVVGRGTQGFPNLLGARAASALIRDDLRALLIAQSRTAMARRVDHLTGLRLREHRALLTDLAERFEIVDASPPAVSRNWRFWSEADLAGDALLEGAAPVTAPTSAEADALATAAIETALEHALDIWSWRITEIDDGEFSLNVVDPDGAVLAVAPSMTGARAAAEEARDRTIALLYRYYSAEGFHIVENLLLRPATDHIGERLLAIPTDDGAFARDPYSQRLTVVLPSGFARDFAAAEPAPVTARPHRFRDPEFRRHATRMIRESAPAHLLLQIYWVDREAPRTASDPASFDSVEAAYGAWLETQMIAGVSVAAARTARAALVDALNAVMATG